MDNLSELSTDQLMAMRSQLSQPQNNLAQIPTEHLMAMREQHANMAPMTAPAFDQMGNATGGQETTQQPNRPMPYGQQMSNVGSALNTGVRQMAKGAPIVGSFLDEMNAATNAGLHPLLGTGAPGQSFSQRYDANVANERGQDRQFESAHPVLSTGLQLGGGVASGGALLKGAPAVGNFILGNSGGNIATRIAAGAASGAGLGAASGFGAGEGNLENRTAEALRGGAIGAGVGAAIPPVTSTGAALAKMLMNRSAGSQTAAGLGVPRSAVDRVAKNVAGDELTPMTAATRAGEIGPDGMVLDMGRQLQGRGEAIASMPGKGQNRVVNSVEDRVRSSGDRMSAELDQHLGPSPDIVDLKGKIDTFYNQRAKPAYDQVMSAHQDVWDDTLQRLTRRPSIQKAVNDAVSLARENGEDIASPFTRTQDGLRLRPNVTPTLAFWDYVKKSMDSRIGAMARNPDPNSAGKANISALLDTKRELVDHLDRLTSDGYKNARGIAADKFTVQEALDGGLDIFKNSLLPEQFKEHLSQMGAVQRRVTEVGARRALQRLQENAPAGMSDGGRPVYRELLQGGENGDTAQKLRMLLGKDATDSLLGAAKRETGYQAAYNQVAANSRTTPRAEAIKDMQAPEAPITLTGGLNRAAAYPVTKIANTIMNGGTERTREGVADLLTRAGPERDATVKALMDLNTKRAGHMTPNLRDNIAAILMQPGVQQGQKAPVMEDRSKIIRAVFGKGR